jgi:tyrosine-protein kinase Etk/Wzc
MNNRTEIKEVTLQDYLDLLLRRKWTVLVAFVVIFSASVYYNFSQPPVYESVATFIIESSEPMIPMLSGVKMAEPARPFEFYNAVVTSRIFREVAAQQIMESLADSARISISHLEAASLLKTNLSVTNPEYSDFIELHAKANDPQVAFILATVSSQTLKQRCQEIDKEESINIVNFVSAQKDQALNELETVEKSLQQFKEQTDATVAGENGGLIKELLQMETELLNIQTQRELAETNLTEYEERLRKLNLEVDASLDRDEIPEINRLRKKIEELESVRIGLFQVTGKNEELAKLEVTIDEKKKELIRIIIRSASDPNMENEGADILWKKLLEQKVTEELSVATLRNQQAFYQNLITNFKTKHPNMLEHALKLNQLNRAKTVHENLHGFLLEKGEEAKIKAATGTGGIRIIDPPNWPYAPIPRGTAKNLLLGFLLGLGLGIGLAFLKEYLDHTIRTPEDITGTLKLPVLGVIPFIKQNGFQNVSAFRHTRENDKKPVLNRNGDLTRSVRLISKLNPKDPVVETYRGLRTNIQFSEVDRKLRSLLITSCRPEEGKTITAANLALAYAEVGLKTVIVDTDLRKPKLHTVFQIERMPGLLECLINEKSLHEVMYPVKNSNLKVIPAGKIPPNPTQVLSSQKMHSFIKTLEHENDIVIFDSPPLTAVTDPILISKQVDGVVLVVRFEVTDLTVAQNSLEILTKARANVVGVVLNSTQFTSGYGYYHQYYNYYHYNEEKVEN